VGNTKRGRTNYDVGDRVSYSWLDHNEGKEGLTGVWAGKPWETSRPTRGQLTKFKEGVGTPKREGRGGGEVKDPPQSVKQKPTSRPTKGLEGGKAGLRLKTIMVQSRRGNGVKKGAVVGERSGRITK